MANEHSFPSLSSFPALFKFKNHLGGFRNLAAVVQFVHKLHDSQTFNISSWTFALALVVSGRLRLWSIAQINIFMRIADLSSV